MSVVPSNPQANVPLWRPTRGSLLRGAALGILLCLITTLFLAPQHQAQRARNERLQSEVATLEASTKAAESLRREVDALKARADAVRDLQTQQLWALRMLNSMVEAQSQQTWEYSADFQRRDSRPVRLVFTEIREATDGVLIAGRTESVESIAEVIRRLNYNSTQFRHADLRYVVLDERGPQSGMPFKFEIRTTVSPGARPVPIRSRPGALNLSRQDPP